MCGIFALLNSSGVVHTSMMNKEFEKGKHRGPEFSVLTNVSIKATFGFHRLAINGLNNESNQPIVVNNVSLICNGEIYNYKQLYQQMDLKPTTDSDCEVIIHLYLKYGIEQTLQMLDGVFAFIMVDNRLSLTDGKIYVARDPYGVRPLYMIKPVQPDFIRQQDDYNFIYGFASELKMLNVITDYINDSNNVYQNIVLEKRFNKLHSCDAEKEIKQKYDIVQFIPGSYSIFELSFKVSAPWKHIVNQKIYHQPGFFSIPTDDVDLLYKNIRSYLTAAVEKRCCTTERPIACLLSGGLDSSLITALVNEYHIKNNLPPIETYSIGMADSEDLKYAKIVADYLGTKHTEILLTEQDFLDAIPDVIYDIESFDTTTVRASIGNWLIGKYISKHSDAKVIFNGDGSDELAGGYLYMNMAPDVIEFDKESRGLLRDIHTFDVLRSDKSISSHGLEPRTPFLDRAWVQFYLSIPPEIRFHKLNGNTMEKYLIRKSFSEELFQNSIGLPLLPKNILWRKKEAFSDGVSKKTRSLFEIIHDFAIEKFRENDENYTNYRNEEKLNKYLQVCYEDPNMNKTHDHLLPKTPEQFYYRKIFESHYKGFGKIIPYFWMPKYINATDASARTLDIYHSTVPSTN
jgi:asparagine synthase (glutamine-hydrolysing)